jgi:hypothetical protein
MLQTAKVKLVTIIASSELQERLVDDLRTLGARGYTISTASGGGLHGPRKRGMWDTGNVRIETLVTDDVAGRILSRVTSAYKGLSLVAFMHDVEAVPDDHFARPPQS